MVTLTQGRVWRYASQLAQQDAMPFHGDCADPVYRWVWGTGSHALTRLKAYRDDPDIDYAEGHGWVGKTPANHRTPAEGVWLRLRCRKCAPCLMQRRRQWTARAIAETRLSMRTWFGTLTYGPEARFLVKMRARECDRQRDTETADEYLTYKFKEMVRVTNTDVTLYLKRIRKHASAKIRYLAVVEKHLDGFPHYHLLVHELQDSATTKRLLESQWKSGFSHWRLVDIMDAKATGYVCKYLSKDASTRVRASMQYGGNIVTRLTDAIGIATNGRIKQPSKEGTLSDVRMSSLGIGAQNK